MKNKTEPREKHSDLSALFLLCGSLCYLVALATYHPHDVDSYPANQPVANQCGIWGAWLAWKLFRDVGWAAFLPALVGLYWGARRFLRTPGGEWYFTLAGTLFLTFSSAALLALALGTPGGSWRGTFPSYGGYLGMGATALLVGRMGLVGSLVFMVLFFLLSALLATDMAFFTMVKKFLTRGRECVPILVSTTGKGLSTVAEGFDQTRQGLQQWLAQGRSAGDAPETAGLSGPAASDDQAGFPEETHPVIHFGDREHQSAWEEQGMVVAVREEEEDREPAPGDSGAREPTWEAAPAAVVAGTRRKESSAEIADPESGECPGEDGDGMEGKTVPLETAGRSETAGPAETAPETESIEDLGDTEETFTSWENFVLPGTELLGESQPIDTARESEDIKEKAQTLVKTLQDFNIEARAVAVQCGPVITMYELELAPGINVNRVTTLQSNISMALKSSYIRIVAPIPGKSTVGVEVPNQVRATVRMKELINSSYYRETRFELPLFLGKEASGRPLIVDLARMPHLLIAGATGSGKSVCVNSVILSLLYTRRPDEVRLILIDPKMVELSSYRAIPHLLSPVVTEMKDAPRLLEWAVQHMEERYRMFKALGIKHITQYNKMDPGERGAKLEQNGESAEDHDLPVHLPYVVVVVEELADLMMAAGKEVESSIVRLAQKSRAVGIHIILSTQRPEVSVITGLIKANISTRIAFKVTSKVDSRTILDRNGAETLIGRGDMLIIEPETSNLVRAQGALLDPDEITKVTEFIVGQGQPRFHRSLIQTRRMGSGGEVSEQERDGMYHQAVRVVLENKRASTSLIQRKLSIGYTRAARMVDLMTEDGIVGPFNGSKARDIQMSLEEWEKLMTPGRE